MEWLSGLSAEQQGIAGTAFLIALGVLFAWRHVKGQKTGPDKPRVQEFYASGQLADMGPVKELVGQTGRLVQQQVRTNVVLERLADALESLASEASRFVEAKIEEIEDRDREEEIERRARIRAEDLMREQEAARKVRRSPGAQKP